MIHEGRTFARAGLVGNPSDGYFGKTISFSVRDFAVVARVEEAGAFEIVPSYGDLAQFPTAGAFLRDQKLFGYYGGMRLVKAAIKRLHDYARAAGVDLPDRAYRVSFSSDIPRLVGLSGSSGIVIAVLRALMSFYGYAVPKQELPTLALSVERDELNIAAGLQDRVIQTYEGMVHMDFARALVEGRGYGAYTELRPDPMPPLYVAFDPARAEVSDVPHRNLRALWQAGDPTVLAAVETFKQLVDRGLAALRAGDWDELGRVVDLNYDTRRTIMPIAPENARMVDAARAAGASAKFAGSGGAICGLCADGDAWTKLHGAMAGIGCTTIRPTVFAP